MTMNKIEISTNETRYDNNVKTADHLGWQYFPEYCYGDTANSKFVTHDSRKGTFTFHN